MYMCMCKCVRTTPYQLHSISFRTLLLGFLVPSLQLHRLEGLREVVTLREILGPLGDVSLQQCTLLAMLHYSLKGVRGGEYLQAQLTSFP